MGLDLRARARAASQQLGAGYWELAEVTHQISREGLYHTWGYETWRDYVRKEIPEAGERQVQYLMQIWVWHLELPAPGQAWARQLPISKARRMIGLADASNWEAWRDRARHMSCQAIDTIRRERSEDRHEEMMDLRARRVWEATRGLGLAPVQHMALMRSLGVAAEQVAVLFGVEAEEVRSLLRLVQVFLPATTVERVATYADQDGRPPDAEICLSLQQVYDDTMPQLGAWGCPALSA